MSAQPGRNSVERSNQATRPSRSVVEETPFLAEDPDMLRWRADVLMDEMMVGAIDLSANGPTLPAASPSNSAQVTNYPPAAYGAGSQSEADLGAIAKPAPGRSANGVYRRPTPIPVENNGHHQGSLTSSTAPSVLKTSQHSNGLSAEPQRYAMDAHPSGSPDGSSENNTLEPEQQVLSAADRYRRLGNGQPGSLPAARPTAPVAAPTASPWAEEQAWQPNNNRTPRPARPFTDPDVEQGDNGVVRRVSAQFASVMAATAANNRRSTLLPRMSTADVDAMQREIFTLQSEIDNVLPTGHEANQRARRLLDKANTILQQDALRSAEVEYYLQQVRTIFQRVQQTIHWSSAYRNRLLVYLAAWLGLAVVVIAARYLFATPLENFVRQVGRFNADHVVLRHFLAVTTALFAGALGGACGALLNLWQQGRQHYGFIDRKYGLRGLILPLMGALVGLLLCLALLTPLSILNVDLARQPVLAALPALLAFLFGLTQESLYGTRG